MIVDQKPLMHVCQWESNLSNLGWGVGWAGQWTAARRSHMVADLAGLEKLWVCGGRGVHLEIAGVGEGAED